MKQGNQVVAVRREPGITLDKSMSNNFVLPLDLEPFSHYMFQQWFINLLTIEKYDCNDTFVTLDRYFHNHSTLRQAIEYLETRKTTECENLP